MTMQPPPTLPSATSAVEQRLLAEYGAIFLTTATPPPKIVFSGDEEVLAFKQSLDIRRAAIGAFTIELQAPAMEALELAAEEAQKSGLHISARSADAGGRSYQETVDLWLRNVERGLDHWTVQGAIEPQQAESIRALSPVDQISVVLEVERMHNIGFSTYFDKSILHSVAAPGASQHLSLLAFDVAEYRQEETERILARHGWYRTVVSDLPHLTYLGHKEYDLERLGLRRVVRKYDETMYRFWVPDLA